MKKIIIAIIVCAVAGAAAYKFMKPGKNGKQPVYVRTEAELGDISDTVETTGEVEPLNRVEVTNSVAGRVDKLLVDEGAEVKQGQVLAYMSSTDRVAILDAARAKSDAELKYWEDTYKSTPVISPLDGKVILRNVVEGQTVSASTSLFALSDKLIVVANVDESDIGKVKVGQKTLISLDAYPNVTTSGAVFQILYEGVNSSNVITYDVKIRPESVPSYFKSKMTANVQFVISEKKDAVLVPAMAVSESAEGGKMVLTGDSKLPTQTPVKTGLDDGNKIAITAGLSAGTPIYYAASAYVPQKDTAGKSLLTPTGPKRTSSSSSKKSSGGGGPPGP